MPGHVALFHARNNNTIRNSRAFSQNPSSDPLHVRDVFTTESFLHLHLPENPDSGVSDYGVGSGVDYDVDASAVSTAVEEPSSPSPFSFPAHSPSASSFPSGSSDSMWQVPPRGEKEIIHLQFRATEPGTYAGYVHVKTDRENMVVPVELEVIQGGLHPSPKEFDFGILTSPTVARRTSRCLPLPLSLLLSSSHGMSVPPLVAHVLAQGPVSRQRDGMCADAPTRKAKRTSTHAHAPLPRCSGSCCMHMHRSGVWCPFPCSTRGMRPCNSRAWRLRTWQTTSL